MAKSDIEPFAYQASTNIDEHRQIVDKTNEIIEVINNVDLDEVNNKIATLQSDVATNTAGITANTTSIANLNTKLTTDETQIATNKSNIESLRDANLIITKEITDIKEVDTEQNTQITALGNADIATATSAFDNTVRKLTIELNPKSGDSITTDVIIPASGETGDEYTATAPIGITNKNIALAIDTDTMEITDDGKLKSKAEGTSYTAGTGITIDDSNAINVDETVIATKATVDNLDTQVKECASGVANAITQAQTANTNALDAYNAVSLSDTHLVLTKGNGNSDEIVLPSGSGSDEWEILDVDNWPTDWAAGDEIEISFNIGLDVTSTDWSSSITQLKFKKEADANQIIRTIIPSKPTNCYIPIYLENGDYRRISTITIQVMYDINYLVQGIICVICGRAFNSTTGIAITDVIRKDENLFQTCVQYVKRKKSTS